MGEKNERGENLEIPPRVDFHFLDQSAARLTGTGGFQRTIGLRAAVTSSTRAMRVRCGAFVTNSGFSSTSFAMDFIASMNRSSSAFGSVSVGSIIRAP